MERERERYPILEIQNADKNNFSRLVQTYNININNKNSANAN